MQIFLYLAPLIAFLVTYFSIGLWMRYLKRVGLVVPDYGKKGAPLIPLSGGIAVVAGMLSGFMVYVFTQVFYYKTSNSLIVMFGALATILLITFIGFLDDLIINKHLGTSTGLKQWQKPFLTLLSAVPLMVVKAGTTVMYIPFIGDGRVDVGLWYPLLFVPIGIVGASNMVNMLAGLNGLEAGMGLVYTGMLSLYAYSAGSYSAAAIGAIAFMSLLVFFYYNKVPAKILPGDSLTYLLGAVIACIAIIGNIEKAALIMSIPFFLECLLKWRSKFKARSYTKYYKDGKVISLEGKNVYSLVHIFSRTGKFTEKQIVNYFILMELFFGILIWIV